MDKQIKHLSDLTGVGPVIITNYLDSALKDTIQAGDPEYAFGRAK